MIHADLHTGSVMVDDDGGLFVIDAEFAMMGPAAFDVGAFLGNVLLAYFAQPGRRRR